MNLLLAGAITVAAVSLFVSGRQRTHLVSLLLGVIDAVFREHGITVPFPQRDVRVAMAPDVVPRGTADP